MKAFGAKKQRMFYGRRFWVTIGQDLSLCTLIVLVPGDSWFVFLFFVFVSVLREREERN